MKKSPASLDKHSARFPGVEIRPFDWETHGAAFRAWVHGRGGWPPEPAAFPKLGAAAFVGGELCAAQWLYMDNSSPMCMLAFLTTNPQVSAFRRALGALHATAFLLEEARRLDYEVALVLAGSGTRKFFQRFGFKQNHTGMAQLLRRLTP